MQMNRRNSLRISDEVANIDFSKYVRFSEAVTSKMFHSQCTDSWTVGESMEMFLYLYIQAILTIGSGQDH